MLIDDPVDSAFVKLVHVDPQIRKLGAQALARLRPRHRTVEVQQAFALERDPGVIKWLALALGNLGDPTSLPYLERIKPTVNSVDAIQWIDVAVSKLRPFNAAHSLDLLKSPSVDDVRRAAAECYYNRLLPPDVKSSLNNLVTHQDAQVRRWASLSAATTNSVENSSPLIENLNDSDYLVREWTECALSLLRDPNAYQPLTFRLTDPEPRVREWAIKALAEYDSPEIPNLLLRQFRTESDLGCKEGALRALGKWVTIPAVRRFFCELLAAVPLDAVLLVAAIEILAAHPQFTHDLEIATLVVKATEASESPLMSQTLASEILGTLSAGKSFDLRATLTSPRGRLYLRNILDYAELDDEIPSTHLRRTFVVSRKERSMTPQVDIGLVFALEEEYLAVQDLIPDAHPEPDESGELSIIMFRIPSALGKRPFQVAAVVVGATGPERAAIFTERMIAKFHPVAVVNVGIAAGIDEDVRLCDVIAGTQVDSYLSSAKAITASDTSQFEFVLAGDPFKADYFLTKRASDLRIFYPKEYKRFTDEAASEYGSRASVLESLIASAEMATEPRLVAARIASGPVVGQAREFSKWLKAKRDRTLKALEMESAAIALATYLHKEHYRSLILRGISDFGDDRKKQQETAAAGSVRPLAARNAFRLFLAVFRTLKPDELASSR
jgi:nucleoside phosphorylase/HEAT repeat protein